MSGIMMELFEYMTPAFEGILAVFQTILRMSGYAAVVALLVIVVRFVLRKMLPAWFAYALWIVVLLRLMLPVGVLTSSFSLFNLEKPLLDAAARAVVGPPVTVAETQETPPVDRAVSSPPPDTAVKKVKEGVIAAVNVTPSPEWIAALVWVAGVTAFLLFAVISHILTLRRLRFAVLCAQDELLAECAKNIGMRRRVRLVSSDIYGSPVVCGLIRPRIVLPVSLAETGSDTLRAILTHELYHIKRFDLLWNLLGTLALAVHWFNPLIWAAAILSHRDRERSCDECTLSVLDDKKQYAETLLTISALQNGISAPSGALAFGEEGVKGRIQSVLRFRKKNRGILALSLVLLVVMGVMLASAAIPPQKMSVSQAGSIVLRDLRAQYTNIENGTEILLEEYDVPSMFRETGMQIFQIVKGFRLNDAFVIKDGGVVYDIPGFGGYGLGDAKLSDFDFDGKKELLYTCTYANGGYGMMVSSLGIYDPWTRSSRSGGGPRISAPMTLEQVSDSEFTLLNAGTGETVGSVTGSTGTKPHEAVVSFIELSGTVSVSAYPNPYTLLMSSSPGMRIDVSYHGLYTGVRYRAEHGTFLTWEDTEMTDVGNDVLRLNGHPVYWSPAPGSKDAGDTVTVTILYNYKSEDPYGKDNILTETVLPVTYDGSRYWIGEGTAPPPKSPD